ncbi:MAG: hypothetical protein ACTSP9_07990 [Promethearchaeota archaeon]
MSKPISLQDLIKEKEKEEQLKQQAKETKNSRAELDTFKKNGNTFEFESDKEIITHKKDNKINTKIKTDHFRTGVSLITGISKREKPSELKQRLMKFLKTHEVVKIDNVWQWIDS